MLKQLRFKIAMIILMTSCLAACASTVNNNSTMTPQQRQLALASINLQMGMDYMANKNYPKAKEKLYRASQQNPTSPTILDAFAYYWEVTGYDMQANKYYKKAVTVAPKSGRALNNYGAYLCRNGQYKKAEKYLLAAANDESYVNSAAAFENAGLCELGVPNLTKAIYYFKRALAQDPARPTSYYELTKIYYKQGKYKLAQKNISAYYHHAKPGARGLWLGVQIAKKLNNTANVLKYGVALEQRFPTSKQTQLYQQM